MNKMRIKELRKLQNLSQRDVEKGINYSQSIIAKWEKGLSEPTAPALIALANFFGVTIDYLVGRESEDNTIIINNDLSDIEQTLVLDFRKLNDRAQNMVVGYVAGLKQAPGLTQKTIS